MSDHNQPSAGSSPHEPDLGRPESGEPSLSEAQPYRTPANVSDGAGVTGAVRSPLLWITVTATAGFVIVGGILLFTPVRDFNKNRGPVKPIPQYVEDFGMNRVPVEDVESVEDITVMQPVEGPVAGPQADSGVMVVP
ncbi:hypothetical protein Enr13x_71260 [Stieleria neptunia]|uniref:Uncharacterized protein n=1 Tax=Stieleria neptunia TaxID=2527979 RepID=A0A518I2G9_9BACT|nr:hypothetical protein [Stieleria neptunia]QDV47217.1 hypothetical protein Enr13x_71260 [Stieleria neptunia]